MPDIERLHLTRRQLIAALPDSGARGVTSFAAPGTQPAIGDAGLDSDTGARFAEIASDSDTGVVLFAREADVTLIVPPFPVEEAVTYSELSHGDRSSSCWSGARTVAVFLLRLRRLQRGGVPRRGAGRLEDRPRFVKNRHRKGGQSQRRFDRIREKQVHELFGKACAESREKLEPYEDEIEHVFLGGDRHTLQAFRKECTYFERFGERVMPRVLPVAGRPASGDAGGDAAGGLVERGLLVSLVVGSA